jgi:predicted house-cleaning noncanonical NTP pyrophosphatase (MazG superfamily)
MQKYNKLVRDRIPEIIENRGEKSFWHEADSEEFKEKLKEKLLEEVQEYLKDDSIEELADILEVVETLIKQKGIEEADVRQIQSKKREKNGGFEKQIILDES